MLETCIYRIPLLFWDQLLLYHSFSDSIRSDLLFRKRESSRFYKCNNNGDLWQSEDHGFVSESSVKMDKPKNHEFGSWIQIRPTLSLISPTSPTVLHPSSQLFLSFFFFFFLVACHGIRGFAPTNPLVDPGRTPGCGGWVSQRGFSASTRSRNRDLLKREQAAYHLIPTPVGIKFQIL